MQNFVKSFLFFILVSSASGIDINITEMMTYAKKHNKHIMIFMHIPNCPYCRMMKEENFLDKETKKAIKENFVFHKIDKEYTIIFKGLQITFEEFSKRMKISAFPATLFMKSNGKVLYRSIGYRNIDEYLTEMKYISTKSYKKISLEKFAENLELEKDD